MGLTQLYLPTEQQVIISSMKYFIFLMKIKSLTDEKQIFSLMRNQFSMWMLFVAGGGKTYTMVGQPVTLFTFSSCPPCTLYLSSNLVPISRNKTLKFLCSITLFTFSSCPPMYSIFVIEPSTNFRKHNPKSQFSIIFPIPPSALFSFKYVTKP